jgi:aryl-alcohol dehydrogenase-like predicted oxidoreductase
MGAALERRDFLRVVAAAAAPAAKQIKLRGDIPAQMFGKTGHRLPVLACGGSALIEKASALWYGVQPLPYGQRVAMVRHAYDMGIRYFDTARNYLESEEVYGEALQDVRENIYLATKVGVEWEGKGIVERTRVRASIETSLTKLRADYLDCAQIHGPVYESAGYDRAMELYEELAKLRQEKLCRFIGLTGHAGFETMYRLIDTKLFDTVFMAYGYFPRGFMTLLSHANLQWRELCLSRARELGMGLLAMKVMGASILGHNAKHLVPDLDEATLTAVRAAALRWALRDKKPPVLVVGVSLPSDIDNNVAALRAGAAFTPADQKLLAEFSVRAWRSKTIQEMKIT